MPLGQALANALPKLSIVNEISLPRISKEMIPNVRDLTIWNSGNKDISVDFDGNLSIFNCDEVESVTFTCRGNMSFNATECSQLKTVRLTHPVAVNVRKCYELQKIEGRPLHLRIYECPKLSDIPEMGGCMTIGPNFPSIPVPRLFFGRPLVESLDIDETTIFQVRWWGELPDKYFADLDADKRKVYHRFLPLGRSWQDYRVQRGVFVTYETLNNDGIFIQHFEIADTKENWAYRVNITEKRVTPSINAAHTALSWLGRSVPQEVMTYISSFGPLYHVSPQPMREYY